ncbi:MAG: acyl-CoA/acyl-ACP dehydrogenase [Halioglobus sp.]|nr:acyl-CoA/acyl-ACP dehydrogenase [Halioglobus sp.]
MNFEFSENQLLIRDQARNFLTQECAPPIVRAALESDSGYDRTLWQKIVELGWTAINIPESAGGLGLSCLELCVIAEELGRSLAPVPFSSSVYLATEAIKQFASNEQRSYYLPKLAAGEVIGTWAHSEGLGTAAATAQVMDGKLSGSWMPVPDGDTADIALFTACDAAGEVRLFLADLTGPGVARAVLPSMDPSRPQAQVTLNEAPVHAMNAGADDLSALLDSAAVLLAFEQIGGCQAALDMGIEYTKQRYAFGRPVASFQAIKHKFADMYVALELARANAYYGACALANDAPDLPLAAATARVSAIDAYYLVSKENIQAHGGMGFTWEFDCHLYYRRAQLLAGVIGTLPVWKEKLSTRLLEAA